MIIQSKTNHYVVDIPSNRLTFLDSRFYITEEGEYVPSVTTVLEAYPKSSYFYEWLKNVGKDADNIRDDAGMKGSNVHRLTELYDNGEEVSLFDGRGEIAYKLAEWNMFEKYVAFRRALKVQVVHNELNVASSALAIGGTIDRIVKLNKELILLDIKTSNAIHPHYWLQLAAYKKLLQDKMNIIVDGIAVLWLNAKTRTEGKRGTSIQGIGWQLLIERNERTIQQFWKRFQACYVLWLVENEYAKPVDISYSLCHVLPDELKQ